MVDRVKQLIAQIALSHQVPELTDGYFVRRRFIAKVDAHKMTHGAGIINCYYFSIIGISQSFLGIRNTRSRRKNPCKLISIGAVLAH